MLSLTFSLNLNTLDKKINFEKHDLEIYQLNQEVIKGQPVEILFDIHKKSNYQNISFGYKITQNQNITQEITYPFWEELPERYIADIQKYIEGHYISIPREKNYNITFWCEESGKRFEELSSFST